MHTAIRTTLRSGAALSLTGLLLAATSLPASAHVRVRADSTASGSYAGLTFRVPNESDTASTTRLVVTLPQDRPLASVSVRPVPGWKASVKTEQLPEPVTTNDLKLTEAPRTITWTAESADARIAPGEYQEFAISAGPLPEPGMLVLPAKQTYSDGEVADWSEEAAEGEEEPEHPAPAFEVTAAEDEGGAPAAASSEETDAAPASAAVSTDVGSDTLARVLGGAALVVALVGAGAALIGLRRRAG